MCSKGFSDDAKTVPGRNQLESRVWAPDFLLCLNCRGEMVSFNHKKNTRLSRMKKTMKEEWVELTDGKRKIIMPRREW